MMLEMLAGEVASRVGPTICAVIYTGLFTSVVAYLAWNAGVARLGAQRAGAFLHLVPLFGAVLSMVLLGEPPQLFHAAGLMLIVAGVTVAAARPRSVPRRAACCLQPAAAGCPCQLPVGESLACFLLPLARMLPAACLLPEFLLPDASLIASRIPARPAHPAALLPHQLGREQRGHVDGRRTGHAGLGGGIGGSRRSGRPEQIFRPLSTGATAAAANDDQAS